jgi:transitional endoplasmic reticulum ATPase
MSIPFVLDYVIEETNRLGDTDEQVVLKSATGEKFKADEAQLLLPRILDHKWYVSERLGRDVGFKVAAVDYVENIYEPRGTKRRKSVGVLSRIARAVGVHYVSANQWPV